MKTDDLINQLAREDGRRRFAPGLGLLLATVVGAVVACVLLVTTMGLRPDFDEALTSWHFDFKFVVTLTAAVSAYAVMYRALFPQWDGRLPLWLLLLAPVLLLAAVGLELVTMPAAGWAMAATGKNAMLCMTVIPALGVVPLGLLTWALRQGAPTRPTLAGLVAGLLAGAIAATFYAANCTDDSPLFVATWYPLAVLVLGGAGALAGRYAARW